MSTAARHRHAQVGAVVLAVVVTLALGSGAAWPAVGGGRAGGRNGGFAGRGHFGESAPHGRHPEGGRFAGRPRLHRGPEVFVFPYFYDPYYGYDPYYPGAPYGAYCDAYSPFYDPRYCFWDDGS